MAVHVPPLIADAPLPIVDALPFSSDSCGCLLRGKRKLWRRKFLIENLGRRVADWKFRGFNHVLSRKINASGFK